MFVVVSIVDTIRIQPSQLRLPTLVALQNEIDSKYPNKVLMDVGLVVARYGNILKITNGSCVPGDGGTHHECLFRLVVFRPFVEEVCVGTIVKSTAEGVQVSLGFFQNIFIPAYWMLRPSNYDQKNGLWVWTPDYGDDEEGDENGNNKKIDREKKGENRRTNGKHDVVKIEDDEEESELSSKAAAEVPSSNNVIKKDKDGDEDEDEDEEEGGRWEMEIGAQIRFKVKSIQFTQVTNTAKGVQATTITTEHSHDIPTTAEKEEGQAEKPQMLRKRSLSVDLSDTHSAPSAMQIIASICEDGLGLTSWWISGEDDEEEDDEKETTESEKK